MSLKSLTHKALYMACDSFIQQQRHFRICDLQPSVVAREVVHESFRKSDFFLFGYHLVQMLHHLRCLAERYELEYGK